LVHVCSFAAEHYKASLRDLTEGTEHIQLSTLLFFPSVYQIHIFLSPSLSVLHTHSHSLLTYFLRALHLAPPPPPIGRPIRFRLLFIYIYVYIYIYTIKQLHRFTLYLRLIYLPLSFAAFCVRSLQNCDRGWSK
jgi:hypothetical protein